MITTTMQKFIEHNKHKLVVFGERRTPEGNPVLTKADLDRADRLFYRFDDDKEFTLLASDTQSAPEYSPRWAID